MMSPAKAEGEKNREAVRTLLRERPAITRAEIAKALAMNVVVVGRHVIAIRAEWGARSLPTQRGRK